MSCASEAERKGANPETANARTVAAKIEAMELKAFFILRWAVVLTLVLEKSTVTGPQPQVLESLRARLRLPARQQ